VEIEQILDVCVVIDAVVVQEVFELGDLIEEFCDLGFG